MRTLFLTLTLFTINAEAFQLYCSTGWKNKMSIVEGHKLKVKIYDPSNLRLFSAPGIKTTEDTESVEFEIPKDSCRFSKTNSTLLDCRTKDVEMVFMNYEKKVTVKETAKTLWMRNSEGVSNVQQLLSLDFKQVPYSGTSLLLHFSSCSNTKPKIW